MVTKQKIFSALYSTVKNSLIPQLSLEFCSITLDLYSRLYGVYGDTFYKDQKLTYHLRPPGYLSRRASLSDSSKVRMSPSRTGPLTFLIMDRLLSSKNSTRT